MSKKVKTLDSLTDSKLLFDKNPPGFGYFLILLVAFFLVAALIWSLKTPKIYMIQAGGVVTNENASYVMCTYTGEVLDCQMEEGKLVEKGEVLFRIKSTDYNVQEEQLELNKKGYEEKIEKYQVLVKSIKDDVNYFDASVPGDALYYSAYESYKAQVKQNTLDTRAFAAYGYSEEQIAAELEKNQSKIAELYYSAIQNAENGIAEAKQQLEAIQAQLSAVNKGQNEYEIKATETGVLHLLSRYKDGMVVQTTQTVAVITPENAERVIEAYVSTADMARIQVGDSVQIVMDGLVQNVYGTIEGTVKAIDSNVTSRENADGSTAQIFKVAIKMDTDYLVSQSGDKVDVQTGMTAVARIRYDKVTYFNYVLEKMGIKLRQ